MLIHNLPQNTRNSCIFFGFYFVLFLHKWTYSKLSAFSEHSAKAKDSQSFECTMISFISNWPISRISTWKAKGNKVFKYLHRQMLIQMKVVTLPKLTAGWQAFIRWCTEVQIWYLKAVYGWPYIMYTCWALPVLWMWWLPGKCSIFWSDKFSCSTATTKLLWLCHGSGN